MKTFLIAGSVVDTDEERITFEDVTPTQINSFLDGLEEGEEVEFTITSFGGSCPAGIAICNLIKQASARGHKTTAHVVGIAASMASAIACACDELKIDANAFLMIHTPWCMSEGNAAELRKDADTLDQYRDALLAVYRTKFDATDDVIKAMLDAETWILGEKASLFNLKCEVIPTEEPLRAAAFAKGCAAFKNAPKIFSETETQASVVTETENAEVKADETVAEVAPAEEPKVEEEPKAEEPKAEEPETEMIPRAEADKRVSGMQSTMAKKLDALRAEYEEKISGMTAEMDALKKNFTNEIQAKEEELTKAKAELTSLSEKLENTERELHTSASALSEKADALTALTSGVLTPSEPTNWKALKGKEFFDWYRKTH